MQRGVLRMLHHVLSPIASTCSPHFNHGLGSIRTASQAPPGATGPTTPTAPCALPRPTSPGSGWETALQPALGVRCWATCNMRLPTARTTWSVFRVWVREPTIFVKHASQHSSLKLCVVNIELHFIIFCGLFKGVLHPSLGLRKALVPL